MIRRLAIAMLASAPLAAGAENLLQVYQDARGYDAQLAAARQAALAGQERITQGRALLLPSLNLTANAARSNLESDSKNVTVQPSYERTVDTYGYSLTFTQPIYRRQNWLQADQGELQARQAELQYNQAHQDLILRTAQAYFDVLAAQDTLALVRAQKAAIQEQLAQAKRNFEVGTATITDTHEAQARYDLSGSQEISAENEVEARARQLQLITGKEYPQLKPLRSDVKVSGPEPKDMQSWVSLAEKQNYTVLIQEAALEIARLETKRNAAGHQPTLDLVASHNYTSQTGSQLSGIGSYLTNDQVSLQFALPLYQGGGISSREREAAYNMERTRQEMENARRTATLVTRQAYLLVINGISQVGALEQALVSSESALQSNRLGYEVGVRINIDVLNAQQQVFSTRRDLALARYNTITSQLRLKAAAGALREEDIEVVNRALLP
ncbi:MAG: TolC family outer membrane protein [Betaproteobacteria bacterium]|nr:TolC family outer membrane protein [Betaproteobacteria bacterium]MDH5219712.1 TolC family outer membrane protein [Betaproteobacteria bacterium]MDH5350721.1 TolC family outer membrane protein [Betaproteobacteria bacterium]